MFSVGQTKPTFHGLSAVVSAMNYIILVLLTIQKFSVAMFFKIVSVRACVYVCMCICVCKGEVSTVLKVKKWREEVNQKQWFCSYTLRPSEFIFTPSLFLLTP